MKIRLSRVVVPLACFAALGIAGKHWLPSFFSPGKGDRPIAAVERGTLAQRIAAAGVVVPKRRTIFTPPYNAYIKKIFVQIGQHVKEGDPIVALTQSLRGTGEESYPLRAPYGGTVVQVPRSEGEFVEVTKENNVIVRVDDLSQLYVYSDLAEAEMNKIKVGQEVVIKANAVPSRTYRGVIREIALASKEKKEFSRAGDRVEYEVRMEILDKDKVVLPGMSTIVDIITGKKENVLTLPTEYVEKKDGKYWATLADGNRKLVQVGLQNEEKFEITSGLKEGEQVRIVDFFSLPKATN